MKKYPPRKPELPDKPLEMRFDSRQSDVVIPALGQTCGSTRCTRSEGGCLMQWKVIPGFPDYEVSEHGDVRRGTKQLKPERVVGSGRKRFGLSDSGRIYRVHAARLVALAFIGPPPFEGAEICHKDNFFHNNHYSNLRWDTHASNVTDTLTHKSKMRVHAGNLSPERHRLNAAANEILAKARV